MRAVKWVMLATMDCFRKTAALDEANLNPDLKKYFWLAEALCELFDKQPNAGFNELFTAFVFENKSKIDKSLPSGVSPTFLGIGSDGVVMDLGNGMVFKIFLNEGSYNHAVEAMERLHAEPDISKTEAMIYDAGALGMFSGHKIYYYTMERMTPVKPSKPNAKSEEIMNHLHPIRSTIFNEIRFDKRKWENLKELMLKKETRSEAISIIKSEISATVQLIKKENSESVSFFNNNSSLQLKSSWLESFVEEIFMKFLTDRTDVHFGNLGVTNFGEFRYFDPSFEGSDNIILKDRVAPKAEDETIIPNQSDLKTKK